VDNSDKKIYSNPECGTIVDESIVNKNAIEFFLVSASVNQGTSTPTKYQCIYNKIVHQNNFLELSSDYIQQLTYNLCHLYLNWFGSIR
jgi:aubergine